MSHLSGFICAEGRSVSEGLPPPGVDLPSAIWELSPPVEHVFAACEPYATLGFINPDTGNAPNAGGAAARETAARIQTGSSAAALAGIQKRLFKRFCSSVPLM